MNFFTEKRVQKSGRPHNSRTPAKQSHTKSRAVTKALNAHGGFTDCAWYANAMRMQRKGNDRSTPVRRVLHACPTRNARVTLLALLRAPTQHHTRLVLVQCKNRPCMVFTLETISKPFPNCSGLIASLTDKIGNNVKPTLLQRFIAVSYLKQCSKHPKKPSGLSVQPIGLFLVPTGFPVFSKNIYQRVFL